MVATVRGGQANYNIADGGAIPADLRYRDLGEFARHYKPQMTPLLTRVDGGAPLDVDPPEWGEHSALQTRLTLGANLGDNGGVPGTTGAATTITLGTGLGIYAYQYTVLEIIDYFPGSTELDWSTRELVWLPTAASPANDQATGIYRGYGGTTPIAHTAGAQMVVFAVNEPQLSNHPFVPVVFGTTFFNYFSRISGALKWDRATLNTKTYEFMSGSPKDYQVMDTTKELKLQLERSIWTGGRQPGNQTNAIPSSMGGIDTFIVSNVHDLGGAALNARSLELTLRDLWKSVDDSAGKTFLMDFDTASIFDTWNQSFKQTTMNDTQMTYLVEKLKFREGVYNIAVSRWCPPNTIYVVDLDNIKLHPRKGNDWTLQKIDGNQHNVAHDEWGIYGDFTLIVKNEKLMAKIHNFTTDPSQYPMY